ncbi:MAG: glycosyltransferase family 9 protein [Pseudomonadota bacterium]|nr:glycosyltransferase family 9 protein [Pseudomonadota bacterium]
MSADCTDRPAGAPRVLVVRLSAIGDIVMASPLASALRRRYPSARISWLVEEGLEGLVATHPEVDDLLVWPRRRWSNLKNTSRRQWLGEVMAFVRTLRRAQFDLAIDAQGLLKSGLWVRLSGATERVALNPREGSGLWMHRKVQSPLDDPRMSSEYLDLAAALELPTDGFQPVLVTTPTDRLSARRLLESKGVEGDYVAVAPFTTRPQKHWPMSHWKRLFQLFEHALGWPVVVLGGPADRPHASRLVEGHAQAVHACGDLSLRESAAVIEGARLLTGVDTGLTHMAAAFDTPAVALFGSTRPYLNSSSPATHVIYHDLFCAPCRRNPTCAGRFDCLTGISPEEVLAHAQRLLAAGALQRCWMP